MKQRRVTIRQRVEDYAKRHPTGFLDEDLLRMDPDAPESSFRKRRTELSEENIILVDELSIGVVERSVPQNIVTLQNLLAAADQALYDAKAANRNCVRVYQPPQGEQPKAA